MVGSSFYMPSGKRENGKCSRCYIRNLYQDCWYRCCHPVGTDDTDYAWTVWSMSLVYIDSRLRGKDLISQMDKLKLDIKKNSLWGTKEHCNVLGEGLQLPSLSILTIRGDFTYCERWNWYLCSRVSAMVQSGEKLLLYFNRESNNRILLTWYKYWKDEKRPLR